MNVRLAMARSRAQGYETERFVRLFAAAQSEVLRDILALVPDLDDAQEVFQETVVDLWKTFDQYDPDCAFVPWACRFGYFPILRFRPYRWHHLVAQNNQGRMELHVNGLPTPAVAVGSDTVTEACRLLLGRLKPEPRARAGCTAAPLPAGSTSSHASTGPSPPTRSGGTTSWGLRGAGCPHREPFDRAPHYA
jgi:hypothetical protein